MNLRKLKMRAASKLAVVMVLSSAVLANFAQVTNCRGCVVFQNFTLNPGSNTKKPSFTMEEDQKLMQLVMQYRKEWKTIASYMEGRSAKQCRERWISFLSPPSTNTLFTSEEDEMIIKLVNDIGPKWVKVSQCLKNKSPMSVKRRYLKLRAGRSFKENWNVIVKSSFISSSNNLSDNAVDLKYIDLSKIENQENLVRTNELIKEDINWSYYYFSLDRFNIKNHYDAFHGLLNYITFYSYKNFNFNEIEINCTGNDVYKQKHEDDDKFWNHYNMLSTLIYKDQQNNSESFTTIKSIELKNSVSALFYVKFKRINVEPIVYAVQVRFAGPKRLVFYGRYQNENWDLLDERQNINDLMEPHGWGGYFVISVGIKGKKYDEFVLQAIPDEMNISPLRMEMFDIHGDIELKGNESIEEPDLNKFEFNSDSLEYNPCDDLTQYGI